MNPLYNFGIHAYSLAAKIAALRSMKIKKMVRGQKETFVSLRRKLDPAGGYLWIHAASLGEFEQARPLIERLRQRDQHKKILLTFFSPSGYEVRKNYPHVDAVAYLPFDTPRNARRFLDIVKPSMAIFVKYEFWGNYLQQLAKRHVPTYLISAIFRHNQIFFRPYGGMFRGMLKCFNRLYLQDEPSRQRLASIDVTNTSVIGDTRFDRVNDVMASQCQIAGAQWLHPFIVFGSSWPADEDKYIPWLNANEDVKFIIAPHEFDDDRVSRLISSISGNVVTLSDWEKSFEGASPAIHPADVRGIVVDSFGKLSALYRFAKVAYVGGGFGVGIHNINEAAVYGIPVVFGPEYHKFKEARDLIAEGGATAVYDAVSTAEILTRYLTDDVARQKAGEIAGNYISRNIGATDRLLSDLF